MFISGVDLLEQSRNDPRDNPSVLVVRPSTSHGECLACSRLPIAHNAPGESVECREHDVLGYQVEDDLLGGVAQDLLELEAPVLLLVVD